MEVRVLGAVEAVCDEAVVELGARKQRAVLAMLAMDVNRPVSVDRIAEGLWGESLPPSAHKMVQLYIHQLRRALRDTDAEIVTRGRGYELVCSEDGVDLHRAERLLDAALAEAVPNGHAREALALWRGPPLADVADEPFAAEPIRRCEELRLRAHELAIDADLARGRHAAVLAEVTALAAEHPLREHVQAQHLLALYRCGRQAEALDGYVTARRRIVEAIGAEPGPELQRVHEAILHHDDAVAAPASAPRGRRRRRRAAAIVVAVAVGAIVLVALRGSGAEPRLAENSAGLLDAGARHLRAVEPAGRGPQAIAVGDGSAWVANALDGTVTRIDPDHDRRVSMSVGARPRALAFGAGSLWVIGGDDRTVAQVDPTTERVVQRIGVGGDPGAVAVGFGAVWVALPGEDALARIDLSAGRTTRRIAAGSRPAAVAAGAGAVWVAATDADQLVRIDPRSATATAAIHVGHGPDTVAVGAGAVWVANRADATVSRVDPATGAVTATVRLGTPVTALAADAEGALAADERGVIVRLDRRGRIVSRLATGAGVTGLATGGGDAWLAAAAARADHRGGTLTSYAGSCGDGPCAVDPAFALQQTYVAVGLAYDGLVGYRRAPGVAGGEIVPALASALAAPTDGGRTYTFTLRRGIRFSDGRPLRAADVRFSLERSIRVGHELVPGLLDSIRGAPACERHPRRCSLAAGVLTDERTHTVMLRLRRSDPLLLHKLANPAASIVPSGTPDAVDGPRPPGTGPYRIAAIARDGTVRLVRNARFAAWSSARPDGLADTIVVRPAGRLGSRLRAVAGGEADATVVEDGGRFVPADRYRGLLTRYPGQVAVGPRLATDFMFLNTREPPFRDVRVRRAVNLATDRARMVALSGGGSAVVAACSLMPPGVPSTRPSCPYTARPSPAGTWIAPNMAEARRLIAASGTRGMRVTVWTDTTKVRFGRAFARLLRDLGYAAHVAVREAGFDYFHAVGDSRTHAQIGMFGWQADYAGPATFYEPILSCRGRQAASPENLNLSQFCDPRLDALVARAEATRGPAAVAAWAAAQRRLARDAPVVPLVSRRRTLFVSARAGNVRQSPFLGPLLEQMWVR